MTDGSLAVFGGFHVSSVDKREAELRQTLIEQGNFDAALASIDQCIRENPEDDLLFRERAHINLYLEHAQQARSDFDTTARLCAEVFSTRPWATSLRQRI